MTRPPLRVGLVGAGRIVRGGHVPAYRAHRDLMQVVAVADPERRNADAVAAALGVVPEHRYADHRDLHGLPLDVVVVASPPHRHRPAVVDALRRGVAVVAEKPLCLTDADFADVRVAAGERGFVAVLHNYLHKPGWRRLFDLVRGEIGRPVMVRLEELSDDHWRLSDAPSTSWRQRAEQGGGPLRDNLYHAFYLAEHILDSPLADLTGAQAALRHPYPGGDATAVLGRHVNGALSQTTALWCHSGSPRATVEVIGTEATLRYRYWAEPDVIHLERAGATERVPVPGWAPHLESGYHDAFRALLGRIRDNAPPPGVADGERIVRLMNAVPCASPVVPAAEAR